jgi:deuterolysin
MEGLTADAFYTLPAGATYKTSVDVASLYDLGTQNYTISTEGVIPVASGSSTAVSGSAYYKSSGFTMKVDGKEAKNHKKWNDKWKSSKFSKRVNKVGTCTNAQSIALAQALGQCKNLATAAATQAKGQTAAQTNKLKEYFKSTSTQYRTSISGRFTAVANACSTATTGPVQLYCQDPYGYCGPNVLAYAIPGMNVVVTCNLFYTALPTVNSGCHRQDQATTLIHELTHTPGVFSPGTQDNAYGYDASVKLTSTQALANADTYALYANAIYAKC